MHCFRAAAYLLVCWFVAVPAKAALPLVTDDTGTQGLGGHQLELSLADTESREAGSRGRARAMAATYSLGVHERADAFISGSALRLRASPQEATSGGSNWVLGLKWRVWEDEEGGRSLAIKPEWFLPVSAGREAAGLGSGRHSFALAAIVTQETAFGAVHVNWVRVHDRFRNQQDNEDLRRFSVAPVWQLGNSWKLALDAGVERRRGAGNALTRSDFMELGLIFSPDKNQDWAIGVIRTRESSDASERTVIGGWTWRF